MRAVLTLVLSLALVGAACSEGGASSSDPSGEEPLQAVAAFYPVQEAAERVGGDLVHVTNLTAPGVEPHDLELTPDSVEAIQSSDVVLYLGNGFQPAVQAAVVDAEGVKVDLLATMPTVPPPEGVAEPGLTVDPHVWLDPSLYAKMVSDIQKAFVQADPQHASTFTANADAFVKQIDRLGTDYRNGLANCQRTVIVTNHAAFGYLASAYGLTQQAISGLAPDAEPSAEWLAHLKDLIQRDGVTTVFTEDLVSPKVAQTLAAEAGVKTEVLHTLEGLTPDEIASGQDYSSQMTENLDRLRQALGCS